MAVATLINKLCHFKLSLSCHKLESHEQLCLASLRVSHGN